MDAAHVHLLLNHVPVLGTIVGLALLGYGLARDSDEILKTGLGALVVVGIATVVVYLTGEPAEELVEGVAGVSHSALEAHEETAIWATWGGGILGAVALAGLWIYRRAPVARTFAVATLVLSLATTGLMAWTANSGGKVHHPELRAATTAEAAAVPGGEHQGADAARAGTGSAPAHEETEEEGEEH